MSDTDTILKNAHTFSSYNRWLIRNSTRCGCFYGGNIYFGSKIKKWIDSGNTALCPDCGIDSVLPENCGYELTDQFLAQMKEHWFGIQPKGENDGTIHTTEK